VGYSREFLTGYRPNDTYYLPEPLRCRLRGLGQPDAVASAGAPAGTYGRAILDRLLIDLSWASSHMEGNTYTWLDTRALIERGEAAEGKAAIETQMILNHKAAIEMLVDNADIVEFNRYTVLNLHSALAENLLPNPADEGRLRRHMVDIGRSVYRPPTVPAQVDEMFDVLLDTAAQIADPFEQSFFAMVHIPYLQPFADVNKRTSRLLANLPLLRANLCPLTFLDVPASAYTRAVLGVYELTRIELLRDLCVWAYERSTQEYLTIKQNLGDPDPVRMAYRDLIKDTVRGVVTTLPPDTLAWIDARLEQAAAEHRALVRTHVIDDLRRLHEGVLARYGLRLPDYERWQERRQASGHW
ncbi:MAG: Fic family protein, partial [Gammaproteobacteria bacterium]|nr:Fic family protein [Gammaproteobacteria bacterium]